MRSRDVVESPPAHPGSHHGQHHGVVRTALCSHGPDTLGMQESSQQYSVSLCLRAVLDFCLSSRRSWSHPLDLLLPLDRSDLCYSDGETEAGRCHDLPYVHEDQESGVHALHDLPAMQLVIKGITSSPRGTTTLRIKSWVSCEKRFSLFKGHDYLVNICADNS